MDCIGLLSLYIFIELVGGGIGAERLPGVGPGCMKNPAEL